MDNKTYLDTLIITGKASTIDGFDDIYNSLASCNVCIEKIANIGLKHPKSFEITLGILKLTVKNCMDDEVVDSSFKEIYRIYRVYDKCMVNVDFDSMVRQVFYDINNLSEPLGCDDLKIKLRRLRIKEIYSNEYRIKINNKSVVLKRQEKINEVGVYFSINSEEELYSMMIDYNNEIIWYPKWSAPNNYTKLKRIRELDENKINMLLSFYDKYLDLSKELK